MLYDAKGNVIEFAEPARPSKSLMTSVTASPFQRGIMTVLSMMPDVDEILREEGEDIYDRILTDGHIWGAWFKLKTRILSKDFEVKSADPTSDQANEIAQYVKDTISRELSLKYDLEHLLDAATHKYEVSEVVYKLVGSVYVPESLVSQPRDRFGFDANGELMRKELGITQKAEPYKFIWHVNERTPKRPYGRSILSRCYWPWRYKSAGWEFWGTALDKFSVPSLAALFELAENDPVKAQEIAGAIATQLTNVSAGSAGAFPNVTSIEQIGGAGKSLVGFDTFMEFCNAECSKAILTSTLPLEEGRAGRDRGDTEVQDESIDDIAEWLGGQLALTITRTLVRWTAYFRFGEAALLYPPKFKFDFEKRATFEQITKMIELKFPVSRKAIIEDYNIPEAADDDDVFITPSDTQAALPVGFADPVKKKPVRYTYTRPLPMNPPSRES